MMRIVSLYLNGPFVTTDESLSAKLLSARLCKRLCLEQASCLEGLRGPKCRLPAVTYHLQITFPQSLTLAEPLFANCDSIDFSDEKRMNGIRLTNRIAASGIVQWLLRHRRAEGNSSKIWGFERALALSSSHIEGDISAIIVLLKEVRDIFREC